MNQHKVLLLLIFFLIKKKINLLIIVLPLIIISSCKSENPIIPDTKQPSGSLSLKEESSTELWIELHIKNATFPIYAMLFKDDSVLVLCDTVMEEKTIIYLDSLLPYKSYKFHSQIVVKSESYSCDTISATTLDTTSHNYSVQVWEFGREFVTNSFEDVAILDENKLTIK